MSSATAVKQHYQVKQDQNSDGSSEADEDSVAMISVRANNQFSLGMLAADSAASSNSRPGDASGAAIDGRSKETILINDEDCSSGKLSKS